MAKKTNTSNTPESTEASGGMTTGSSSGFLGLDWSNPFTKQDIKNIGFSVATNIVGGMANKALSGGMTSGAGNVIGGLTNVAAMVPGPWGAVASGALQIVGGLTNRMFGSKLNQENINKAKSWISDANRRSTIQTDWNSLIQNSIGDYEFNKSFIGKDGMFSNTAKNIYKDLNAQMQLANNRMRLANSKSANTIMANTVNNLLRSSAYGGKLNRFPDGGYTQANNNVNNTMKNAYNNGGSLDSSNIAYYNWLQADNSLFNGPFIAKNSFDEGGMGIGRQYENSEDGQRQFTIDIYKSFLNVLNQSYPEFTNEKRHLLATLLTQQAAEESGYGNSSHAVNNNYGGHRIGTRFLSYDDMDHYTRSQINNTLAKWNWTDAIDEDSFAKAILHTKEETDANPELSSYVGYEKPEEIKNYATNLKGIRNRVRRYLDWDTLNKEAQRLDKAERDLKESLMPVSEYMEQNYYTGVPLMGFGIYAQGGNMNTNTNNFTEINNGGSHEQNPLGGVPMGTDNNGTLNVVEEGETVYDDYVYSNRLTVPEEVNKLLNLGKKELTFAQASKKLQKESRERPNDPISKKGLKRNLSVLQNAQEAVKAQKHQAAIQGVANIMQQEQITPEELGLISKSDIAQAIAQEQALAYAQADAQLGLEQYAYGGRVNKLAEGNWLQNAEAIGALGSVLTDAFGWTNSGKSPEAQALITAANNTGYMPVSYNPIGTYQRYEPIDTRYTQNTLTAQQAAQNSLLRAMAGLNPNIARASLQSSQSNYIKGLGDLAIAADKENYNRYTKALEFNRDTDTFNSNQALEAAKVNAQNSIAAAQNRNAVLAQAYAMAEKTRLQAESDKMANWATLSSAIKGIGDSQYMQQLYNEMLEHQQKNGNAGVYGSSGSSNGGRKLNPSSNSALNGFNFNDMLENPWKYRQKSF